MPRRAFLLAKRNKGFKGSKVKTSGGPWHLRLVQKVFEYAVRYYRFICHVNFNLATGVTAQTPEPPMGAVYFNAGTVCQLLRRDAVVNNIAHLLSDAPTFQILEAN